MKEWKKQIKKEIRGMEREINQLTQAEKKIQKEIQATAKKGCVDGRLRAPLALGLPHALSRTRRYAGEAVKVLAREVVRTRRCKEKMCVRKTRRPHLAHSLSHVRNHEGTRAARRSTRR